MITADPNLAVFRLRDKAGVKAGEDEFSFVHHCSLS
jgi:hypothetical protein